MKKNKRKLVFSFLLAGMVFTQMTVAAADKQITRVQNFTAPSDVKADDYNKYVNFEKTITEDGKEYRLKKVDYKVTSTEYLDKKEKTMDSQVLDAGQAYEPDKTLMVDGDTYRLKDTKPETKVMEEGYDQTVTAFDDYDYAVTGDTVPATKTVTAVNRKTGQQQTVACSLSGVSREGTTTVTNQMTITFSDYNAAYYAWNGNLIPRDDEVPALNGYEAQLLSAVNAQPGSTITNIAWAGGVYRNENGVDCRDAVAAVQQVIPVYRANYTGTIHTEAKEGIVYHSTYEGEDKDGRAVYSVRAAAVYEEKIPEKTPVLQYVLTGAGIIILLGALVGVFMILSKRKKEREEK